MPEERRQLGLGAAIAIVTGESIGLGVFLTSASMAKSLGSPLLLGLVWCAMGAMALCGALCYSELAVRFPRSGGEYIYLRRGFGPHVAFLYGWMSSVVMYPGVAAALAVGVTVYLGALLPAEKRLIAWIPALLLVGFGVLNILGTRWSGRLMALLNYMKFGILAVLVGASFFSSHAHVSNLHPFVARATGSEALFPAIAGAVVGAFFTMGGWWEAGKIGGEIREPEKNLPRAFMGGVVLMIVSYVVINFAFLMVLPISAMHSGMDFVTQFSAAVFGSVGVNVLSACVLVSVGGGLAALMMAAPRVSYAMAQSGEFLPALGRLHRRFGTPANAILLQTVLSLTVLLLGTFDRILACIIFSVVVFQALTAAALFRLPRSAGMWWFPSAPLIFIACSAAIAFLILMHDPAPALIGVAVVLCGLPLRYFIVRRTEQSPAMATERN
jgi:basic amino acid/polyamine antiporter, APA family